MKRVQYAGSQQVRIENVPWPGPPGRGEVLVRVELAALCGTNVVPSHATAVFPSVSLGQPAPLALGQEMGGTVVEIGPAVRNVTIGQRIIPGWWCGECQHCLWREKHLSLSAACFSL